MRASAADAAEGFSGCLVGYLDRAKPEGVDIERDVDGIAPWGFCSICAAERERTD